MKFHRSTNINIVIPKAVLTSIFNDCDRFDVDETGGRIIGFYSSEKGNITLNLAGVIESGPDTKRSPTYYLGDAEYQEQVFRSIEERSPEIEHLGNWHTHHVNGFPTLSGGDLATYRRVVNHPKQNTPFFYALLVVARQRHGTALSRYSVRHYFFLPNDDRVYEIPAEMVSIVEEPILWPLDLKHSTNRSDSVELFNSQERLNTTARGAALDEKQRDQRVLDRDVLEQFYPSIRPFTAESLGLYWRGPLQLIDGSSVEVIVLEDSTNKPPTYSIALREAPPHFQDVSENLSGKDFQSARVALVTTERDCNNILFRLAESTGVAQTV